MSLPVTPRFVPFSYSVYNLLVQTTAVLTAGSADSSFPVSRLQAGTPTHRWRSLLGWNIISGFNNKLDVNAAGVLKVASVSTGNYASGALIAAAVQSALAAAVTSGTWSATYDTTTKKLSIGGTIAHALLGATGANIASGILADLGYSAADTVSSTSHLADLAAYHSREYILLDAGSSQSVTVGVFHGHNMSSGGTVTLYGSSASTPWSVSGTSQALAGDDLASKRLLFFGSQVFRYWAVVINDVQNTAGYSEVGVLHVGTYYEFTRAYKYGFHVTTDQQSKLQRALDGGALYVVQRKSPKKHTVKFEYAASADGTAYRAIEDIWGHVFFAKDPQNYPGAQTVYGVISKPADVTDSETIPGVVHIDVTLSEDLG